MSNCNSGKNFHSLSNLHQFTSRLEEKHTTFTRSIQANATVRDWRKSSLPLNEGLSIVNNGTSSMPNILEQKPKLEASDQILPSVNLSEINLQNDKAFLPSITLSGFYKPKQYPLHSVYRPAVFSPRNFLPEKSNNICDNSERAPINLHRKNFDSELEEIVRKRIALPPNKFSKTIILDLDETLVHCSKYIDKNDIIIKIKLPNGTIERLGVKIRPFTREFLHEISKNFEVFVFTASNSFYADPVLDSLDPEHKYFARRVYRESCVHKGRYKVKDLRIFANRNLKDIIIIDNSWSCISNQKDNGILISSWYGDLADCELHKVLQFLNSLHNVKDVRESIKRSPNIFTKNKIARLYICL